MNYFNEVSIMDKLPLLIIIVFLIVVVALLMMDIKNLTEISERQNSIKDKIDSINVPECPACPANPKCPDHPGCPACPDHPGFPDITPSLLKSDSNNSNSPNIQYSACPLNAECPACPSCPSFNKNLMPTANEIANAIFPGRLDGGLLFGGRSYPVEEYVRKETPTNSNNNQTLPTPVDFTNSNIVPVTDTYMGGYTPFQQDKLLGDNMYPVNLNPFTTMNNSNSDICLTDPGNERCSNSNRPNMNKNSPNSNSPNSNSPNSNSPNSNK